MLRFSVGETPGMTVTPHFSPASIIVLVLLLNRRSAKIGVHRMAAVKAIRHQDLAVVLRRGKLALTLSCERCVPNQDSGAILKLASVPRLPNASKISVISALPYKWHLGCLIACCMSAKRSRHDTSGSKHILLHTGLAAQRHPCRRQCRKNYLLERRAERVTGHLRLDILGRRCDREFLEHSNDENNLLLGKSSR